jgi:hypothetical protein
VASAVEAAQSRDLADYETAVADLEAQPSQATAAVLASAVRTLLEAQHPDGLDSDDMSAVLARCYTDAVAWCPVVDLSVLLAVLASALGVHEPGVTYDVVGVVPSGQEWRDPSDEVPHRAPTLPEYLWHAPLLLADLLAAGRTRLSPLLDSVFGEIATAESMEMP